MSESYDLNIERLKAQMVKIKEVLTIIPLADRRED